MVAKILMVDDEARLLAAARRNLGREFNLLTATSAKEALEVLKDDGPVAVIVTDMSMPGMSGLQLLKEAAKIAPDTVNIMLTGNADIDVATNAFNEGTLFRYFTKPCTSTVLVQGLRAALRQHQLISAEKQLLTQTLSGTIKLLTNILASVDPAAFSRSGRIRGWLRELRGHVDLPKYWAVDMAAMLAPIGSFTLPPTLLAKAQAGEPLSEAEQQALDSVPGAAADLLRVIPRMDDVTAIIGQIHTPYRTLLDDPIKSNKTVFGGASLLHILFELADQCVAGTKLDQALLELSTQKNEFDTDLVALITPILLQAWAKRQSGDNPNILNLRLGELQPGDILRTNIVYRDTGRLILAEGHELSEMGLKRILNDNARKLVLEPVLVERVSASAETAKSNSTMATADEKNQVLETV